MPEIIHDEPQQQSIVETHLGEVMDTSKLGPIKMGPTKDTRQVLFCLINSMRDTSMTNEIVDAILDYLIVQARPQSALASLFLKRVKEGRA